MRHLCSVMTKEQMQNKLNDLKETIRRMNLDTVDMINASAIIELNLRNSKISNDEMTEIEEKINYLLKKYNNNN